MAAWEGLDEDAREIVEKVLSSTSLEEVCAGGVDSVKQAVRSATVNRMFAGSIESPRDSGTAAGHYLADRCREVDSDYPPRSGDQSP